MTVPDSNETDDASVASANRSRRDFVASASAAATGGLALQQGPASAAIVRTDVASLPPYGNSTLPAGIRPAR